MPRRKGRFVKSKRVKQMEAAFDVERLYSISDAVKTLKSNKHKAKFDETVDLIILLSIDPQKADQNIRGSFSLPNGTGKKKRVIAFCEGEMAQQALAAGAVKVGGQELADEIINTGWMEFDVAIAHPSMMRFISKLGKTLGPRGLMPSPKAGTVTTDVIDAVTNFQAGMVEFRPDKRGAIQIPVGKMSFTEEQLVQNLTTFIDHLNSLRPHTVKGRYVEKIVITSTMGPGLKVAL
ncbi:MAG: 50S ribosomal protein L1 [Planctomycetota bacterium]